MRRMKRIMDHIHSGWNEDISLRELAAREFLSEGYLSRFLKQNLDMTYSQYVMGLRLEHAEKQLRSTDPPSPRSPTTADFTTPVLSSKIFVRNTV